MSDQLEIMLKEYQASPAYPFHMPGHKRSMNPLEDGPGIYGIDITEIDGFDNLHDPQEILRAEMERAARLWGAKKTFFSVNGSTCAMLVAISAAVPKGGNILIERGCHMSVYHAAYLRELNVSYIEEYRDASETPRIPEGIHAVIITSPSYEGLVPHIRAWADAAHACGALLIVDEAHGAHLGFHPYFPDSAVHQGADLIAQSTHKTLPAMTQTALLHVASDRVDIDKVRFFFDIYETSSPSYVLMASITSAVHLLEAHRTELFEAYANRLTKVRARLSDLTHFSLDSSGARDPGKLMIRVRHPGVRHKWGGQEIYPDGPWLYDLLRKTHNLQMEMRGPDYVLAMTSFADTDEALDRLAHAMELIDGELVVSQADTAAETASGQTGSDKTAAPASEEVSGPTASGNTDAAQITKSVLPVQMMPIHKACESPHKLVQLTQAAGRVAADFIILYPPDAPLIVPGEVFTPYLIRDIQGYKARGFQIIGDDTGRVPCVCERNCN